MRPHSLNLMVVSLLLVANCSADSCPASDGPVTCEACKEGADINALDGIPRFSRSGSSVPSNLGDYDPVFVCSEGPDPTCEATEISSDQVSGGSGAEASSIVAWAESLAVYSAFAWVLAIAFALFACGSIALRRCCCCCCGRYGTCGQTQPTRKGDGCFKLGFHVFPVPTVGEKGSFRGAVAPAGQDGELLGPLAQEQLALSRVRYPAHSKWGSRVCLGLYVFFVVVFVILGNEKGNFALTEAQKSLAAAPTGIMQSIQSMTQPLNALVINMADRVAASSLRDINSTITAAVDVRLLALDTQCLRDGFSDDLPDPSAGERFIGNLSRQVQGVNSTLDNLAASLETLEGALGNATAEVDDLSSGFRDVNASQAALQGELGALDTALANMSSTATVITASGTGASATADQVDALTPQPDQALASGTSTELTSDISGANDGGAAGTPAWTSRNATWTNLLQLHSEFSAFPDLAQLADNLEALNGAQIQLARSDGAFADAEAALASINSITSGLPSPSALNASILRLNDLLLALPVPGVLSALEAVNASLILVPAFNILDREVQALQEIIETVQCAQSAQLRVQRLNETVVQLPDVLEDLNSTIVELNDTRASTEASIADARDQAQNVTRDTAAVQADITDTYNTVQGAFNDTRPENLALDFSDVQSRLAAYAAAQAAMNSSSGAVLAALESARPALSSGAAQAPAAFIADLRSAAALFATTATQVATTTAAYTTWHASGRCSSDHSTCDYTAASSCSVGSCLSGQRLCSAAFPTVPCTADADCGADSCLYVDASFVAGRDQLATYGAAPALSATPPAGLAAALRASHTAVSGIDFTGARTAIGTFQASLTALDPAGVLVDLNDTRARIQPDALGVPAARDDVAKARQEVQFDFGSLSASSADLNATLADVEDLRATVEQVDDGVDELAVFLYEPTGLLDSIARLQSSRLRQIADDEGTSGMLRDVSRTLDNTIASLNKIYAGITATVNGSALLDVSAEGELNSTDALDRVDAVTSDRFSRHGPYHFLAALQHPPDEPCNADAFVCAVDPQSTSTEGGGVFRDKNGLLWDEDRTCITLGCINNQIDEWNKGPLTESADFSGTLPLAISRESATFLPYLIPLFMVLVAAMPLFVWKGATWQRWPMCASTWCIAACTPIIFAVIGGLLFPLIIAGHDVCRGGANAAHTAATAYPAGFCTNVVGGTYNTSSQLCELSVLGNNNPVEVDVAGTIGAVLGDCARFDSVLDQVYESLEETARDTPLEETNTFIKESQGADGAVRPLLARDMRAGANNASVVAVQFVTEMEQRLGCSALNDRGAAPFTEAMCCDLMDSFYWLVSSWYLIGFSMCLCGWPASLLGYKRLPNALWGDLFEDVYDDELALQIQHASTVAKRRRRSSAASGWATSAGAAAAAAALNDAAADVAVDSDEELPKGKAAPLAAAPVAFQEGDDAEPSQAGGVNSMAQGVTPPQYGHQGGWTSAAVQAPSPVHDDSFGGRVPSELEAAHDPSVREHSTQSDHQPAFEQSEQAPGHVSAPLNEHPHERAAGYDTAGLAPADPHFSSSGGAAVIVSGDFPDAGSEHSGDHNETGGIGFIGDDDFVDAETAPDESSLGFGFEGTEGGVARVHSWGNGSSSLRPRESSLPPLPTAGVTGSPGVTESPSQR